MDRADVDLRPFLYIGAGLRRRLGVTAGDVVSCRLSPADPDHVPVPADVREALDDAGRRDAFEARRPADRRRLLQPIADAQRPETRAKRIRALVQSL